MLLKENQVTTAPEEDQVAIQPTEGDQVDVAPKEDQVPLTSEEDQVTTLPEEDHITVSPEEDQITTTTKEDHVTMTPKKDPTATPPDENQINETSWSVLRKILEKDPSGMDRLNLECMMCKLPMSTKANELDPHKAVIMQCGHIIGISCLVGHLADHEIQGLPFACPFNECGPSFHPECGCGFLGFPFPEKVENIGICKRTAAEGLELMPKCYKCAFDEVLQSLTLLTGVLEWKKREELKSFKVAYRIQIKDRIWGAFEEDERECTEGEIPASMREHCRNVEASLATLYSFPDQVLGEKDLKIRFFEYSGPLVETLGMRRTLGYAL